MKSSVGLFEKSCSHIPEMSDKQIKTGDIASAEIVLPGKRLAETLSFFTDELGFRVDSIYPADAPRVAVVSADGVCLRLDAEFDGDPGVVRVKCGDLTQDPENRVAPNGTLIEFVSAEELAGKGDHETGSRSH